MKWKYYRLSPNDERAKSKLMENLRCGDRTLARKLLSQFPIGDGTMFAIEMESLDLESLTSFSYATYLSGKTWVEATGMRAIPMGDRPIDGLISFLTEFLGHENKGAIVIQNVLWDRSASPWKDPLSEPYCLPTRHSFFNEEVYHVLTPQNADSELMEDTIREAWHQWFVGVCADNLIIPEDDLFSQELLDELVHKTKHIFVPAFDNGGFLIWTPPAVQNFGSVKI